MSEAVNEAEERDIVDNIARLRGAGANGNGRSGTKHREEGADLWPELHHKVLYGLAGQIVSAIKPQTEADPVGILLQLHVSFGNAIGRNAHYQIEDTTHHANLFASVAGASARARKGTSEARVRAILKQVDQEWEEHRIKGGLSSGEGFINEVRDELQKWNIKEKLFEVVEPAVADKRLLIIEPEFAGALAVMERHGNTLSPNIRKAYDGGTLAYDDKGVADQGDELAYFHNSPHHRGRTAGAIDPH